MESGGTSVFSPCLPCQELAGYRNVIDEIHSGRTKGFLYWICNWAAVRLPSPFSRHVGKCAPRPSWIWPRTRCSRHTENATKLANQP